MNRKDAFRKFVEPLFPNSLVGEEILDAIASGELCKFFEQSTFEDEEEAAMIASKLEEIFNAIRNFSDPEVINSEMVELVLLVSNWKPDLDRFVSFERIVLEEDE